MPPKRKAVASPQEDPESPPLKRRLRSHQGPSSESQPAVKNTARTVRGRKATATSPEETKLKKAKAATTKPAPKPRGRAAKAPAVKPDRPQLHSPPHSPSSELNSQPDISKDDKQLSGDETLPEGNKGKKVKAVIPKSAPKSRGRQPKASAPKSKKPQAQPPPRSPSPDPPLQPSSPKEVLSSAQDNGSGAKESSEDELPREDTKVKKGKAAVLRPPPKPRGRQQRAAATATIQSKSKKPKLQSPARSPSPEPPPQPSSSKEVLSPARNIGPGVEELSEDELPLEATQGRKGKVIASKPPQKRRGRPPKASIVVQSKQPRAQPPPLSPSPGSPPTARDVQSEADELSDDELPADVTTKKGAKDTSPKPRQTRRGRPRKAVAVAARNLEPDPPRRLSSSELSPAPSGSNKAPSPVQSNGIPAEESSDDEILLSPPKRKDSTPRPRTPPLPKQGTSRQGARTPRLVMDSVEIKSPFRFPKPSLRDQGSPVPSNQQKSTNNTLRDKSPSPSTSTKPASEVFPPAPSTPPRTRTYSTPRRSFRRQLADSSESDFDQFLDEDATPRATAKKSPSKSPVKGKGKARADVSDAEELPDELPDYLHACLQAQKRAALKSLYNLSAVPTVNDEDDEDIPANRIAYEQLNDLLKGTVLRAEGNSCIVTGPPGSGKTQLVEEVISGLPGRPIVIRLSGHAQTDDRLAMREIAWQLAQQTGRSLLPKEETADQEAQDEENPFLDTPPETAEPVISIPPPAHLLALISVIPTLSRPTIIVLDAFELFALHPRQSLLYCLFDTAQHSRVGANGKGMAVVGVTTRIDTINLLEKRVKSRFSGRILRTAGPGKLEQWVDISRIALCAPLDEQEGAEEWTLLWKKAINAFLESEVVRDALEDTFELTRDLRMLTRILTPIIAELTPSVPFPTPARLKAAIVTQRAPGHQSFLRSLPYPAMCLLIAAMHARTAGHDIFTFEMLHEEFRDQVRTSHSAPVQVEGGGIGMVRCSRDVLMGAFEKLVSLKVFIPVAAPSAGIAKEFVRYRCSLERADVKTAVDKLGQLNLKKWFTKGRGG